MTDFKSAHTIVVGKGHPQRRKRECLTEDQQQRSIRISDHKQLTGLMSKGLERFQKAAYTIVVGEEHQQRRKSVIGSL